MNQNVITDDLKIEETLQRGVEEIIMKENLFKRLKSGVKLRIKLGIDPTSPNIHLGRSIPLLKLRDLQNLGHTIVLIIGNFTGTIGDTSDKESERPMLSEEVIEENLKTYIEQASKIIDISKAEIVYNKDWLGKLSYVEIGKQADAFSLSDFIGRDNIKKRLDAGKRVSLRELLYPLMQGYDSVAISSDIEIGGMDQKFNILAGRDLQKLYGQEAQDVILGPLIEGLDGRKMSSSWGNTVNLKDSPDEIFGKIMSLKDEYIIRYFKLVTRVEVATIENYENDIKNGGNPKEIKMNLAEELVRMYHGEEEAKKSSNNFDSTFSKKEIPENIPSVKLQEGKLLSDILIEEKIIESKTEFTRLIRDGAISELEKNIKITDIKAAVEIGTYRIGKHRFLKIV